jgi:hypothetical protein
MIKRVPLTTVIPAKIYDVTIFLWEGLKNATIEIIILSNAMTICRGNIMFLLYHAYAMTPPIDNIRHRISMTARE